MGVVFCRVAVLAVQSVASTGGACSGSADNWPMQLLRMPAMHGQLL
jgi:hypothetical protein